MWNFHVRQWDSNCFALDVALGPNLLVETDDESRTEEKEQWRIILQQEQKHFALIGVMIAFFGIAWFWVNGNSTAMDAKSVIDFCAFSDLTHQTATMLKNTRECDSKYMVVHSSRTRHWHTWDV